MPEGIRPSADAPADNYYYQPWWVREAIRTEEVIKSLGLTALSDKDVRSLVSLANTIHEKLGERAK